MTGTLTHIVRHPIKSIGWEMLQATELAAGRVLPFDRHWAVAHDAAAFANQPEGWMAKRNFVRGVAGPALMAISATLSDDRKQVSLAHPDAGTLVIEPDTLEGSAALINWITPMWPETRPTASRIVAAPGQAMTDSQPPFVSILNLASLRDLGQRMDRNLSIHRFRGNLWFEGAEPWGEFDWIGREIRVGDTLLRVDERITRCNATTVDPATGHQDADTLGALNDSFGHRDFGVYATVVQGGQIRLDDTVILQ